MKNKLKVSVIMPSYNQGQYIAEAIESVLSQTYKIHELIIVDNFSTDQTQEVVQKYSNNHSEIKFFQFNNQGVIAAGRNYAVKQATGDLLAFIDTDDVWLEDKLKIQIPALEGRVAVSSNCTLIGEVQYGKDNFKLLPKKHGVCNFSFLEMLNKNWVVTSSLIMRKSDFRKLNGFDESDCFKFIEDYELWLRLLFPNNILGVIAQPLLYYRVIYKEGRDLRQVSFNKLNIADKLKQLMYIDDTLYQKFRKRFYSDIARSCLLVGDKRSRYYYWKSVQRLSSVAPALVGLVISFLPLRMQQKFIGLCYQLRFRLKSIW